MKRATEAIGLARSNDGGVLGRSFVANLSGDAFSGFVTQLVFILSLPRSGSTLLQRLLLADGRCRSIGEHSLLLRFLGDDEVIQRRATYWEPLIRKSMGDLRSACPDFDEVYRTGVRQLAMGIYDRLAGDKPWFVDKTPRYHLICEELIQTFPEAKFIVLWRHPLAVAASIATSFRNRSWLLDDFDIDLHAGMQRLHAFTEVHADSIHVTTYEDLVTRPAETLRDIGEYLGWENLERVVETKLPSHNFGTLGDRTGTAEYQSLSAGSRDAWRASYDNWFRRSWARGYFSGSRQEMLRSLGYEYPEEIDKLPSRWLAGLRELRRALGFRRKRITKARDPGDFLRRFYAKQGFYLRFK